MIQNGPSQSERWTGAPGSRPPSATAKSDNVPTPEAGELNRTANGLSIVSALLQAPALAAGENIADYRALVDEVWEAVQPKGFFDRLIVSDLCHALWEEQRFRRQQAALPAATRMKALACLLVSIGFEQNALAVACDYFGDDDEERNKAIALVRRFGITDDAISAQASQDNLHILSALERLMGNRQSRRDTIVREYQRRQRKAEKRSGSEPRAPRGAVATGH
jgi:hypothetical protein